MVPSLADGGAETMIKDYAILCDNSSIDMKVVSWSQPLGSATESALQANGIDVVFLGSKSNIGKLYIVGKLIRRVKKYITFCNLMKDVDVLHVHLKFGLYTRMLSSKILKRTRLFYTVHNIPERYFDASGKGQKGYEYREAKRLISKYDMTMVTLHDQMNQSIKDLFDTGRVVTVNNGIDFVRFNDALAESRDVVREQLGIPADAFVIGHVGSFTEQKNHKKLIDIYKKYHEINTDSFLLLIGKGVLKNGFVEQVRSKGLSDNVIFLENRSDIPQLMKAMDVFVFPSLWEGFGNVLIEAQLVGLRCVISDRVPKDAILSDSVTVLGVEDSDEKWIDAIDDKLTKAPKVGELSEYDIRKSICKLEKLWLAVDE